MIHIPSIFFLINLHDVKLHLKELTQNQIQLTNFYFNSVASVCLCFIISRTILRSWRLEGSFRHFSNISKFDSNQINISVVWWNKLRTVFVPSATYRSDKTLCLFPTMMMTNRNMRLSFIVQQSPLKRN